MEIPVRVVARGAPLSAAAASMIADEAQSLKQFFPRILSCEVHVDGPGRHHRRGDFQVRMVVGIAGRDIVISRQRRTTLHEAVTDAFRAAGGQAAELVSGFQNPDATRDLARQLQERGLYASVGSDFHFPGGHLAPGSMSPVPRTATLPVWTHPRLAGLVDVAAA